MKRLGQFPGLSVGGVFFHLARRILICLAMNDVLAWMTLRWKSIIPAGIAHTMSNILVVAGINYQTPWSGELRILEWRSSLFSSFVIGLWLRLSRRKRSLHQFVSNLPSNLLCLAV
jgi:hypothetical protein